MKIFGREVGNCLKVNIMMHGPRNIKLYKDFTFY